MMPDIVRAMADHGQKERETRDLTWKLIDQGQLIWDWDRKIRVRKCPECGSEKPRIDCVDCGNGAVG